MSLDCFCDFDSPSFYDRTMPVARKLHKCEECGGPISVGERYERVFGKWDDYVSTFKTCARCVDIRTWVKNNVPCLCWAHGNMIENCEEAVTEAQYRAPEETRGLRFGFLRRLALRDRHNKQSGVRA